LFMAEYASMFAVSGIATFLFLGGWHDGLGLVDMLDSKLGLTASGWIGAYIINVIGLSIFIAKGTGLVFFQMWVRWTLPRLRIDQVMMTCLKYLLPISCTLFLGAIVWPLALHSFLPKHRTVVSIFGTATPIGDLLQRKQPATPRSPEAAKTITTETKTTTSTVVETTPVGVHGKPQPKAH
jgi:NADH-quinone oxidoreductase subunit H